MKIIRKTLCYFFGHNYKGVTWLTNKKVRCKRCKQYIEPSKEFMEEFNKGFVVTFDYEDMSKSKVEPRSYFDFSGDPNLSLIDGKPRNPFEDDIEIDVHMAKEEEKELI